MAWNNLNPGPLQTQVPWFSPSQLSRSGGPMGITGSLTPSDVSSASDTSFAMPQDLFHVTIAPAGGAGTYTFAHNLHYTPTTVIVIVENTQGVTPTIEASVDWVDINAAANAYNTATTPLIYINFSNNCTADVYYG